jgi:hypothetical protein
LVKLIITCGLHRPDEIDDALLSLVIKDLSISNEQHQEQIL